MLTSKIDVESAIEPKGGCNRRYDLSHQTVQVGVGWSLDVQVSSADVVDGLVVNHESTVGMFQSGVSGQDRVVRLNNSS